MLHAKGNSILFHLVIRVCHTDPLSVLSFAMRRHDMANSIRVIGYRSKHRVVIVKGLPLLRRQGDPRSQIARYVGVVFFPIWSGRIE